MNESHLRKAANTLGVVFGLSVLTMAGLIDGERITGEPCSIWLYLAVFVIGIASYIGFMALSDMVEMQKKKKPF